MVAVGDGREVLGLIAVADAVRSEAKGIVADLHRGQASAHNLEDGSGVEFILDLRGMPRRRLGGNDPDE